MQHPNQAKLFCSSTHYMNRYTELIGPSQPLMLPSIETRHEEPEIPQGPISLGALMSLNPQHPHGKTHTYTITSKKEIALTICAPQH